MIHICETIDADTISRLTADADRVVILTDSNVADILGRIADWNYPLITIPAGEENKNISICTEVWEGMSRHGMTRKSVLLNVGGGVVTDLGGFCAATYMRGIRFVNVATTLLGAVDASIGGKTGVDLDVMKLGVMKNRVGAFALPEAAIIPLNAFASLPEEQLRSGYAEMVKAGYISSKELTDRLLSYRLEDADFKALKPLIERCISVKEDIVKRDFRETGERKWLNFGHTVGHAIEEMVMARGENIPHGCAVAHGILPALIISYMTLQLSSDVIYQYARWLTGNYPPVKIGCEDYDTLLAMMVGDKKNYGDGKIRFVLLRDVGNPIADCCVEKKEIKNALDIYRDLVL